VAGGTWQVRRGGQARNLSARPLPGLRAAGRQKNFWLDIPILPPYTSVAIERVRKHLNRKELWSVHCAKECAR